MRIFNWTNLDPCWINYRRWKEIHRETESNKGTVVTWSWNPTTLLTKSFNILIDRFFFLQRSLAFSLVCKEVWCYFLYIRKNKKQENSSSAPHASIHVNIIGSDLERLVFSFLFTKKNFFLSINIFLVNFIL